MVCNQALNLRLALPSKPGIEALCQYFQIVGPEILIQAECQIFSNGHDVFSFTRHASWFVQLNVAGIAGHKILCGSFFGSIGPPLDEFAFSDIENSVDNQDEYCQNNDAGKYANRVEIAFCLGDKVAQSSGSTEIFPDNCTDHCKAY